MNKTDDILERLKGRRLSVDRPDELTERIMASLPEREARHGKPARRVWLRVIVAAAACVVLLLSFPYIYNNVEVGGETGLTFTTPVRDMGESGLPTAVQDRKKEDGGPTTTEKDGKVAESPLPTTTTDTQAIARSTRDTEPKAIYASQVLTDSTAYQPPSLVDDFIAKFADYNCVKPVALNCSDDSTDTRIANTAYVFQDTEQVDLFGRLIQVAVTYDQTTPGYRLNLSNNQLVFQLNDERKNLKYLWMAERISGQRILLFSAHSPIGQPLSIACYQDIYDRLTHTGNAFQSF